MNALMGVNEQSISGIINSGKKERVNNLEPTKIKEITVGTLEKMSGLKEKSPTKKLGTNTNNRDTCTEQVLGVAKDIKEAFPSCWYEKISVRTDIDFYKLARWIRIKRGKDFYDELTDILYFLELQPHTILTLSGDVGVSESSDQKRLRRVCETLVRDGLLKKGVFIRSKEFPERSLRGNQCGYYYIEELHTIPDIVRLREQYREMLPFSIEYLNTEYEEDKEEVERLEEKGSIPAVEPLKNPKAREGTCPYCKEHCGVGQVGTYVFLEGKQYMAHKECHNRKQEQEKANLQPTLGAEQK